MQPLSEDEHGAWDLFVEGSGNGTIFHTAWWHKAWGADVTVLARRDDKGAIEAGLPVCLGRFPAAMGAMGVLGVRRPPLTPVNGPVHAACRKPRRCSRYSHAKKEFVEAIGSLPALGFYDFSLGRLDADAMPFMWNGFETQVGYTYVIPASEADTWRKDMSEKTRRALKGAYKEAQERGCRVEVGAPLDEALDLYRETIRVKDIDADGFLRKLPGWWAEVRARGAGENYILRDADGRGLCAAMLLTDRHSGYAMMNGMKAELRRESHLNMLVFEKMIEDMHASGRDFDFNGSMLMGVERFFRGWGGEMKPYFRVLKIPSPLAYFGWKAHSWAKTHRKSGWVSWKDA